MTAILTLPSFGISSASAMPLQPTTLEKVEGEYYVPSTVENIRWGHLPNRDSKPVLTVPSGSTVTFDTVSHEALSKTRDEIQFNTLELMVFLRIRCWMMPRRLPPPPSSMISIKTVLTSLQDLLQSKGRSLEMY